MKELLQLGTIVRKIEKTKYYPETVGCKLKLYPQELLNRYVKREDFRINEFINETIQFKNKNTFQIYIGDYDIVSTQHYKGKWLQQYCSLK
jgi:chemotaxis methyl-accepting protein methylase